MKLALLGASGRTGRLVLEQALARGHQVRALVRPTSKLGASHPHLEVLTGELSDGHSVADLVRGCDAVVSALGPVGKNTDVCSAATRQVIAAGAKRYVVVSGAGLDLPGDRKDLVGKVVSFLVRTVSAAVFADKVLEASLLTQSPLDWVLVRPPRLVDGPGTGHPKLNLERSPGASITRADLATFVLEALTDERLSRRGPFVAG